ncbi:histidine kinase [Undibacterium jejuense]|uniref:Histidine kinase n=2 Tax=Undibacterium jejuense TaxID=1344949 RepID=A0A923KLE9_9BURK|nr:histidine kinase [Undibacterium jejuense]
MRERLQKKYQVIPDSLLKKIIGEIPRLLVINFLCAILVTFIMRNGSSFLENLVFSNAIGFSCHALIRVADRLIWGKAQRNMFAFYLLCIFLAPVGFTLGSVIGALIFSYPVGEVLHFQSNYISAFIALSCLISVIAAWSFWNKIKIAELIANAEKEKARTASIERQAMQAQLQLLQAQIEPHMLFNTLANLQGLIAIDTDRAQHMLAQLIVYLRATLSSSRAENISLKQEFILIQAYLDLLAIRMGKRLRYTLDLPSGLEEEKIPPMLLQPLVENAIKHGLEPKVEGGEITVSVRKNNNQILLEVSDTGLGLAFNFEKNISIDRDRAHVGNANIRERLLALFGEQATFNLKSNLPEGAIATITLPALA